MRGKFLVFSGRASLYSRVLFTLGVMTAAAFIVLSLPAISYAAVIVEYDIANNPTTYNKTSLAAGTVAPYVTASAITNGPGVSPPTSTFHDGGSFCAWYFTTSASLDTSDYFQIQITPAASAEIDFSTVTFALARDYYPPDFIGPVDFKLRYSTNGTDFTTIYTGSLPASDDLLQTVYNNVDISSIGTVSGTVYFRFYGYNAGATAYPSSALCFANASGLPFQGTGANVTFDGTVTPPPSEIDVLGNSVSIVNGDTAPSAADHTDFGDAEVTSGSVVRTFTIENKGTATLNLTGSSPYVTIGGTHASEFSLTSIPSGTIVGGGTTTFDITFDPSASGIRNATISIANDDSDEDPYSFSIQGMGNYQPSVPELLSPSDGALGVSVPVSFRWMSSTDPDGDTLAYKLYVCDNQTFTDCDTPVYTIATDEPLMRGNGIYLAGTGMGFVLMGFAFGGISRRRMVAVVLVLLVLSGMFLVACGDDNNIITYEYGSDFALPVESLLSGEVYYWKVVASDGIDETPSPVWDFTTE